MYFSIPPKEALPITSKIRRGSFSLFRAEKETVSFFKALFIKVGKSHNYQSSVAKNHCYQKQAMFFFPVKKFIWHLNGFKKNVKNLHAGIPIPPITVYETE
jgi:hypothetical protein